MKLSLDTEISIIHTRKFVWNIIISYLTSGLYGFILTAIYRYTTGGVLLPTMQDTINSLFFWPVSSFVSAQDIFGAKNATIWSYLTAFNIILFYLSLFSYFGEKLGTELEQEIEPSKDS